jgi:hypothetical protein
MNNNALKKRFKKGKVLKAKCILAWSKPKHYE